jgi:hypothetical protein
LSGDVTAVQQDKKADKLELLRNRLTFMHVGRGCKFLNVCCAAAAAAALAGTTAMRSWALRSGSVQQLQAQQHHHQQQQQPSSLLLHSKAPNQAMSSSRVPQV